MKKRNQCVYKGICNGSHQKCRSCQLQFAPYDKAIAIQLQKEAQRSKHKFEDERDALAAEIMAKKQCK